RGRNDGVRPNDRLGPCRIVCQLAAAAAALVAQENLSAERVPAIGVIASATSISLLVGVVGRSPSADCGAEGQGGSVCFLTGKTLRHRTLSTGVAE
ncbi:Hypothetical predicted protein, partial [Olea europaea subsp. europaea]